MWLEFRRVLFRSASGISKIPHFGMLTCPINSFFTHIFTSNERMVAYGSLTSSYCEQCCNSMCGAFGFYKLWCKGSKLLDYIGPNLIYWAVNDIEIALYEIQIRNKLHHFKIHGSARKFLFHYYSDFSSFWFRYFWDSCHDFFQFLFVYSLVVFLVRITQIKTA